MEKPEHVVRGLILLELLCGPSDGYYIPVFLVKHDLRTCAVSVGMQLTL